MSLIDFNRVRALCLLMIMMINIIIPIPIYGITNPINNFSLKTLAYKLHSKVSVQENELSTSVNNAIPIPEGQQLVSFRYWIRENGQQQPTEPTRVGILTQPSATAIGKPPAFTELRVYEVRSNMLILAFPEIRFNAPFPVTNFYFIDFEGNGSLYTVCLTEKDNDFKEAYKPAEVKARVRILNSTGQELPIGRDLESQAVSGKVWPNFGEAGIVSSEGREYLVVTPQNSFEAFVSKILSTNVYFWGIKNGSSAVTCTQTVVPSTIPGDTVERSTLAFGNLGRNTPSVVVLSKSLLFVFDAITGTTIARKQFVDSSVREYNERNDNVTPKDFFAPFFNLLYTEPVFYKIYKNGDPVVTTPQGRRYGQFRIIGAKLYVAAHSLPSNRCPAGFDPIYTVYPNPLSISSYYLEPTWRDLSGFNPKPDCNQDFVDPCNECSINKPDKTDCDDSLLGSYRFFRYATSKKPKEEENKVPRYRFTRSDSIVVDSLRGAILSGGTPVNGMDRLEGTSSISVIVNDAPPIPDCRVAGNLVPFIKILDQNGRDKVSYPNAVALDVFKEEGKTPSIIVWKGIPNNSSYDRGTLQALTLQNNALIPVTDNNTGELRLDAVGREPAFTNYRLLNRNSGDIATTNSDLSNIIMTPKIGNTQTFLTYRSNSTFLDAYNTDSTNGNRVLNRIPSNSALNLDLNPNDGITSPASLLAVVDEQNLPLFTSEPTLPGSSFVVIDKETQTNNQFIKFLRIGQNGQFVQASFSPNCAYSLDSTSSSFNRLGGTGIVRVTTNNGCSWTATSNASWITINSFTGNGNGEVNYTVANNATGAGRVGTMTIADQTFTVTQSAIVVMPLAPSNLVATTISQTQINLTWQDNSFDETGFKIERKVGSNGTWSQIAITNANTTGFTNTNLSPLTQYFYRVRATNDSENSLYSNEASATTFGTCTYTLSPASQTFSFSGGTTTFNVSTQAGCNWTAISNASWITTNSSGSGNGLVTYTVATNTSTTSRTGTISVANQTFTVTQSGATSTCTYTLSPTSQTFSSSGGTTTFNVSTQAGCNWTAISNASWITTNSSGSGNSLVTYTVATNTSTTSRTGTISVANQTFTVTQSGATSTCTYTLSPTSQGFQAIGGTATFNVLTSSGCSWTAVSNASWITIGSGSGTGNNSVIYTVATNATTSSRTGNITVGGQVFTVTQQAGQSTCTYTLSPTSQTFTSSPSSGSFVINTPSTCSWVAVNNNPDWINITSGSQGTGSRTIFYAISANNSPSSRTGTISVAGQIFTITQSGAASTCTYTLSPASQTLSSSSTTTTFNVNTQAGCNWTATSNASWITTNSSGSGNGFVTYTVATNTSTTSRTGTISVANQIFTITQSGAASTCTYTLSPTSQTFSSSSATTTFNVSTQTSCNWTAISNASWITTNSSGSGNSFVTYTVATNTSTTSRTGTISVANQTFTVNQQAGQSSCTYSLSPTSQGFQAIGGTTTFNVLTSSGCSWTAVSNASWITIGSGSGTGNNSVIYTVATNATTSSRSGSITVGGQVFSVTQQAGQSSCTYSLNPPSQSFSSSASNGSFVVNTLSTCSWSVINNNPIEVLNITAGEQGTGTGTVRYSLAANTSPFSRTLVITVADQTHTITQSGNSFAVNNLKALPIDLNPSFSSDWLYKEQAKATYSLIPQLADLVGLLSKGLDKTYFLSKTEEVKFKGDFLNREVLGILYSTFFGKPENFCSLG